MEVEGEEELEGEEAKVGVGVGPVGVANRDWRVGGPEGE